MKHPRDMTFDEFQEHYSKLKKYLEDHPIFIRSGECVRCGECCKGCPNLSYDKDGLAVCDMYEERPQVCKDTPLYPLWSQWGHNADKDRTDRFSKCGYRWELNPEYSYTEIQEVLDYICDNFCVVPENCRGKKITITDNIKTELGIE